MKTDSFKIPDSLGNIFKKVNSGHGKEVRNLEVTCLRMLYQNARETDLIVHCCAYDLPFEYTYDGWNKLGDMYVEAARNGATFLYVMPPKGFVDTVLPKNLSLMRRASDYPAGVIDTIRYDVIKAGAFDSIEEAERRIILHQPASSMYWVAGVQFRYFSMLNQRGEREFLLLQSFSHRSGYTIPIPGVKRQASAFRAYLDDIFDRHDDLAPLWRKFAEPDRRF